MSEPFSNDPKVYGKFREWAKCAEIRGQWAKKVRRMEQDLEKARAELETALEDEKDAWRAIEILRSQATSSV